LRIGIDPGLKGGLALLDDKGRVRACEPMPVISRAYGRAGNQVDGAELSHILYKWTRYGMCPIYLERVAARPNQGVASMFSFGHGVGVIEGVAAAFNIPLYWVLPTVWKRRAGLLRQDKDASRLKVRTEHPEILELLKTKDSVGIADAVLIAEYGNEQAKDTGAMEARTA